MKTTFNNVDLLYKLYIEENKTREELSKILNLSVNNIKYLVLKYNLKKPRCLFSKNIGKAQIGKNLDSSTKTKISNSKRGCTAWNKNLTKLSDTRVLQNSKSRLGQTRNEEQKKIISIKTKEAMRNPDIISKLKSANKNRNFSKETRNILSNIAIERWKNPNYASKCSNPKFGNKTKYKNIIFMSNIEVLYAKKLDEVARAASNIPVTTSAINYSTDPRFSSTDYGRLMVKQNILNGKGLNASDLLKYTFHSGGVVGGEMTGDEVVAKLKKGEVVFTPKQIANLLMNKTMTNLFPNGMNDKQYAVENPTINSNVVINVTGNTDDDTINKIKRAAEEAVSSALNETVAKQNRNRTSVRY